MLRNQGVINLDAFFQVPIPGKGAGKSQARPVSSLAIFALRRLAVDAHSARLISGPGKLISQLDKPLFTPVGGFSNRLPKSRYGILVTVLARGSAGEARRHVSLSFFSKCSWRRRQQGQDAEGCRQAPHVRSPRLLSAMNSANSALKPV